MKTNPCKDCDYSFDYNGRKVKNYKKECFECEKRKAHEEYLKTQRKYVPGEVITSLDELLQQEWVIWGDRTRHIEVVKNLQLNTVLKFISHGYFRKAIRREK